MDNPFDQFDQPSQAGANPFDQFDSGQTVTSKAAGSQTPSLSAASFKSAPSQGGSVEPQHFSRFLNGVFKGYAGAEQLLAHGLNAVAPETAKDWVQGADRRAQNVEDEGKRLSHEAGVTPDRTDWWNLAGQVASPVNWAGGEGAVAAGKALPWIGRAVEGSNILKGGLQGAGIAAPQPVTGGGDYATKKAEQVGLGTAIGGVGAPLLSGIGSIVKPAISEAAQTLADAGVRLTPGQLLGGYAKRFEDILQSYPFAGQLIRNARDQAGNDFQVGAANKVLREIGEKVDKGVTAGPELINHVEDKISQRYQAIHPNVGLSIDQGLVTDLGAIAHKARSTLSADKLDQLQRIMDSQITDKLAANSGTAPGKVVQSITSELGRLAKGYRIDQSFDARELGLMLGDVREAVTNALERQNPAFSGPLQEANNAWRLYAKMRDAAGRQGGELGQFSPAQLEMAAKRGESAGAKAKGTAPLQEYAAAGKQVLPSKVGDSGTPERAALMGAYHYGLGGLGHGMAAMNMPGLLAPGIGIAGVYNPLGQRLARAAILSRPAGAEALRDAIKSYAPAIAGRGQLNGESQ